MNVRAKSFGNMGKVGRGATEKKSESCDSEICLGLQAAKLTLSEVFALTAELGASVRGTTIFPSPSAPIFWLRLVTFDLVKSTEVTVEEVGERVELPLLLALRLERTLPGWGLLGLSAGTDCSVAVN